MAVDIILTSVSLVQQIENEVSIGTATGFFFSHDDKLFLVTNKHVVIDKENSIVPEKLRLRLHRKGDVFTKNDDYDVQLYSDSTPVWKTHKEYDYADIAVIQLEDQEICQKYVIRPWSKVDFLPPEYELGLGEDVFIMGYPRAFYDRAHNFPILRNAMIATPFGIPFQGLPLFLTDANLHPGTSGSPIITRSKNTWFDQSGMATMLSTKVCYILGIHSGSMGDSISPSDSLGLGAGWYINLVEDIAKQF